VRTAQRDSAEGTRTIAGQTLGALPMTTGPGWSVERLGVGSYRVRLLGVRTILSAQADSVGGTAICTLGSVNQPDSFVVSVFNTASAAIDAAFQFTATVR
jgi:hypothetical protein